MEQPLPQPPPTETSQFYSSTTGPKRVGSLLLQSVAVTVPTFSKELDLGSIANPQKHSTIKQYLFASLLFKPLLALLLDCFSLVFLSGWVKASIGKGNSSGLVIYALATTGSIAIMLFGGWRASQVLKKGHIQAIFVSREAYRWVCLTNHERFMFFERIGQGYGLLDAVVFFAWFTLRDWMQHLLCDLPRLVINCTILVQVGYQQSLKDRGETPTLNLPELSGITHFALALNIMLQVCNLVQFLGALVILVLVRMGKLVSLRKDEHLHTYCQRNLNVRIVRLYKLAKSPGTTAPLRDHNVLEQQQHQNNQENGIDLSAIAWDTETQDEGIDYNHYAYRPRPRPISNRPSARPSQSSRDVQNDDIGGEERIEMTEQRRDSQPSLPAIMPTPGSFSYAQMQHLQLQRQKYGDNRELYEAMEWKPPAASDDQRGRGQGPGQWQTAQQQQQQVYQHHVAPSPEGSSIGARWTPLPVPPKDV
ncbi:hypothetical protein BCR41DRAFT_382878 [Lobosporangium transversale]|uniref:Uncharacterized protein n=1 Tax=Lobosporangium transversale TaxID=64571 RepID=A0A1Y2H4S6_9FUNG|nr:hypothetical protein BCR41DRAFT_382878 [Lobosporangium transversale]ORZ28991.1 hypothetical protein BCR41DRAFT_382878 [Lobosporangium transversale]|eukprot:XP_021886664.1 hypothetical protein BCR41DRAFT_382878 [Lobosporangium transversale]